MSFTLPEFGNRDQITQAVKNQKAVIDTAKALVGIEQSKLVAIRAMCEHEYTARSFCGRDAGSICDHCGDFR